MYISPPIAIPILLAIGVAVASSWPAPAQREAPRVSVDISAASYAKLVTRAKGRRGSDGRVMTVGQVVESFANSPMKDPKQ